MQPSPELSTALPESPGSLQAPARAETIVYQCVTIAAMLLLLGTLWVF